MERMEGGEGGNEKGVREGGERGRRSAKEKGCTEVESTEQGR